MSRKPTFKKINVSYITAIFVFMTFILLINILGVFSDDIVSHFDPGGIGYDLLKKILAIAVFEVYIFVTMLFFLIIVSHTKQFNNLLKGKESRKEFVLFTLSFGVLISLSLMSSANTSEYCILCGLGIFLAAISGRWKTCLWSTIAAILISCIPLYGMIYSADEKEALPMTFMVVGTALSFLLVNMAFTTKQMEIKAIKYQAAANVVVAIAIGFLFHLYDKDYKASSTITELVFFTLCITIIVILFKKWYNYYDKEQEAKLNKEELSVAHKIQMSAMPTEFFSSKILNYFGTMESAIEMGGDFYDCYEIKKNLVAIVIADVSDKGLVAAMFMMKAKGAIKSIAMVENDPGKILELTNNQLCIGNEAEQFVTAWVGILDTDTGIIKYSDAGHTCPLVMRNKKYNFMKGKKGLVMGFEKDVVYTTSEMKLNDGDVLFLYTDGITEARNTDDQMYGADRLMDIVSKTDGESDEIIQAVKDDVTAFRGYAPISDDITMFCLRMRNSSMSEMTVESDESNLSTVTDFVSAKLTECGCPSDEIIRFEIIAEELFVNICSYAYGKSRGSVTVFCRYIDNEIKMTFCDRGMPFDPVKRSEVLISDDVSNWSIGGFGIHMVKKMVDSMNYKRLCDLNILTVRKKTDSAAKE